MESVSEIDPKAALQAKGLLRPRENVEFNLSTRLDGDQSGRDVCVERNAARLNLSSPLHQFAPCPGNSRARRLAT